MLNVTTATGGTLSGGGGGISAIQAQQIITELQAMHQTMQNQGAGGVSGVNQYIGPNHFAGVSNIQQLYALFNQMSGYAFEGGSRGATQGLPL